MIIQMTQDHSAQHVGASYIEYSFYLKNNKIGSFKALGRPSIVGFSADYIGSRNIKIQSEKNGLSCPFGYTEQKNAYFHKEVDGTKKWIGKSTISYYDKKTNKKVGTLSGVTVTPPKRKKIQFFRSYMCKKLNYDGIDYYIYNIIAGSAGIYYCIYVDDQLVAMIHKHAKVINYKDNYTIYALNQINIDILCLIAADFDYSYYEEVFPDSTFSIKYYTPLNKDHRQEVMDKYDPNFIQKIKDMESEETFEQSALYNRGLNVINKSINSNPNTEFEKANILTQGLTAEKSMKKISPAILFITIFLVIAIIFTFIVRLAPMFSSLTGYNKYSTAEYIILANEKIPSIYSVVGERKISISSDKTTISKSELGDAIDMVTLGYDNLLDSDKVKYRQTLVENEFNPIFITPDDEAYAKNNLTNNTFVFIRISGDSILYVLAEGRYEVWLKNVDSFNN